MKHVASFSTGLSSAVMIDRLLTHYDPDRVHIVYMDTLVEDRDNWRFAEALSAKWQKRIHVLTDGRTPYEVAEQKHIIPNQKIAPCTFELKIKPFKTYLAECIPAPATIHIGYDIFEAHRCEASKTAWENLGYTVDFPLLWKPLELRSYAEVVRSWGIEPPRTYAMGFSHANCLQRGCVKMGQADWLRLLINYPDRYHETEQWEQSMRCHPTRRNYSIMRDQSNGTVAPLTLKQFREQYEAQSSMQPSLFDKTDTACVYCGVGDLGGAL